MGASPREGPDGERTFPRTRRLTRGPEIRGLFQRGKRSRTRHLDVFAPSSPAARSRAALVVPKHGHGAVERNRLKRRLREILRAELLPGLDSATRPRDVLVRARREAYHATFAELRDQLAGWLEEECSRES